LLYDLVGNRFDLPAVCLNNQIRDFPVQGVSCVKQLLKPRTWVGVLEQWSFTAFLRSHNLLINCRIQIHDKAPATQSTATAGVYNSTTARGKNNAIHLA
jgi:hypothetical protein